MTSELDIDEARQRFCDLVAAEWVAINQAQPDVPKANRQVETADKLVDSLATQGQEAVQAMLLPLLDNESPQVRYAAAGHLLHHGAADRATDVLQALVDDPNSGVRGLAFALLRTWQRQNH